ncbi:MAG TPA: hypothetical protein VFZ28_15610 [Burkholderiaceae bacterium]|nr:hypothetical protein [Burkholderiaceae bacterium]
MQGLLDVGTAMDCGVAIEAFKMQRFGGDFAAMLAWWLANKNEQHLALAAGSAQRTTPAAR